MSKNTKTQKQSLKSENPQVDKEARMAAQAAEREARRAEKDRERQMIAEANAKYKAEAARLKAANETMRAEKKAAREAKNAALKARLMTQIELSEKKINRLQSALVRETARLEKRNERFTRVTSK